jgi:hypothetical protein
MRVTSWAGEAVFLPLAGFFASHDTLVKHFLTVTKPFCGFRANVLKRPPCIDGANGAPKRRQALEKIRTNKNKDRGRPCSIWTL